MEDQTNYINILKANNVLLNENLQSKISTQIKLKVNVRNVATFYQMAKCFNSTELLKYCLCNIEHFFALVSDCSKFLELDYISILCIISSSNLNIDCEIEVFNATDKWISYDFNKRRKYLVSLLSKVRLNLISQHALNAISNSYLSFLYNKDCLLKIKESLINRNDDSKPIASNLNRYCNQNNFHITIIVGCYIHNKFKLPNMSKVDGRNFKIVKELGPINHNRGSLKSVYCRGAIYVFGGISFGSVNRVEKYCLTTNRWDNVACMLDSREDFSACSFMSYIFLIGGYNKGPLDSSAKYNTKSNSWEEAGRTHEHKVASAVYKGTIVVSGGWDRYSTDGSSSVEVYDHAADTWAPMPNMVEGRIGHASLAVKNKLFVVGSNGGRRRESCEVFDSKSKKFALLKQFPGVWKYNLGKVADSFSIGCKLVSICHSLSKALCYDVEKDEWSAEPFDATRDKFGFRCTLIHVMSL